MFGRLLFVTFLAVPLIEIALFVLIGGWIGLVPTLLGVLVTAIAGSLLIRWQGMATLGELQRRLSRGELPAREMGDAVLIGAGGLLLLLPGYFTDLVGLVLLLPWSRGAIYALLARHLRVTPASPAAGVGQIDLEAGEWRGS